MMNKEPKQQKPKSRDDLIRDILRLSNVLTGSVESVRGEDDKPATKEQVIKIQKAFDALSLGVTSLRQQLSPHIVRPEVPSGAATEETPTFEVELAVQSLLPDDDMPQLALT